MKHGPNLVLTGTGLPIKINKTEYDPIKALGPSLLAWWDASRGITITGSGVSSWADRKNGYAPLQGTDANRPTYSATAFNGAPGVVFNGTTGTLRLVGVPAGIPTGAGECWVYSVVQQDALAADATNRYIFQYGTTAAATARHVRRGVTTGTNRFSTLAGDGAATPEAKEITIDFSGRKMTVSKFGATAVAAAVDRSADVSTAVVPATGTTVLSIGSSNAASPTLFWNGIIRDIIVTAPLSAAQEMALEAFLLARRRV